MNDDNLFNISAEKAILCAIMLDNTVMSELEIWNSDFYREAHKVIYECMGELYYTKQTIDIITLQQKLNDKGKLDAVGGLAYLFEIYHEMPTSAGVKAYADIIRECSMKRELRRYATETLSMINNEECDTNKLIDNLQDKLSMLTQANNRKLDVENIADKFDTLLEELKAQAKSGETGLPTGFIDLDNAFGGLMPGTLNILAARPGMGKTAFALNIARNAVFKYGKSVLFISLEMKKKDLKKRLYSSLSGIELSKIIKPSTLSPEEWKQLERAKGYRAKGFLDIEDDTKTTVMDIAHKARQFKHEKGLDLLIIDYLQLMSGDKRSDNRVQEVSQISRALKILSMDLNIPVICLSQLNRGLESRENKRPRLADLRESGSIEQDADIVWFIYRDIVYNPDSEIKHSELIIAKNRNGSLTTIPLYFNGAITTFRDLSKNQYQGGNQ